MSICLVRGNKEQEQEEHHRCSTDHEHISHILPSLLPSVGSKPVTGATHPRDGGTTQRQEHGRKGREIESHLETSYSTDFSILTCTGLLPHLLFTEQTFTKSFLCRRHWGYNSKPSCREGVMWIINSPICHGRTLAFILGGTRRHWKIANKGEARSHDCFKTTTMAALLVGRG